MQRDKQGLRGGSYVRKEPFRRALPYRPRILPLHSKLERWTNVMKKVSLPATNDYCPQTLFAYGTYKEDGTPNFGLFCWLSYCWDDGLSVMCCIGEEKLTKDRIRATGRFSACLITEPLLPLADYLGSTSGRQPDKMNLPVAVGMGAKLGRPPFWRKAPSVLSWKSSAPFRSVPVATSSYAASSTSSQTRAAQTLKMWNRCFAPSRPCARPARPISPMMAMRWAGGANPHRRLRRCGRTVKLPDGGDAWQKISLFI